MFSRQSVRLTEAVMLYCLKDRNLTATMPRHEICSTITNNKIKTSPTICHQLEYRGPFTQHAALSVWTYTVGSDPDNVFGHTTPCNTLVS